MRFRRATNFWFLFLIPLGILVILGGWILVSRGRPVVTEVFPLPDSAAVPGLAPIRLGFSRPMNQASVIANLEIQPPQTGEFSWEGDMVTFTPSQNWPGGETITITVKTGARSSIGLPLAETRVWSFTAARTMLAYLWPSDGPADIYMLDPVSGETIRLTETPYGVLDFSLNENGLGIYFSAQNASDGADIMYLDLVSRESTPVLACNRDLCGFPQISPGGDWLAYEDTTNFDVHLYAPDSKETILAGQGGEPAWSSKGLLSFYNPQQMAYLFFDPNSRETKTFNNETGEPGDWSRDGSVFVAPEIITSGDPDALPSSHLIGFVHVNGIMTDLSRGENVEDTSPAFSPDGSLIAFARKFLDNERWTPGRQLWVMDSDGENARPLTDAPLFNHSAFAWHPDGSQIAFVRSNQATLNEPPEIWLISEDGSEPTRLVIGGFAPQWIP